MHLKLATTVIAIFTAAAALAADPVAPPEVPAAQSTPAPGAGVLLAQPPKAIKDFTLTDQDGKAKNFAQLRGRPVLVFFGFTHCPDVCPTTMFKLRQLQRSAPSELSRMRIVLVSVDGERDDPATLKRYLARFSPQFIGLTGPPSQVAEIAAQFPAVFFKGIAPRPGGDYVVQHSPAIYAIDAHGELRAQFTDASIESMIAVLRSM